MMTMERFCYMVHGLKPTIMMVTVQAATAGVNVFYKLASNNGMTVRVIVAYRFLFASAVVVPLALYVERNKRPKLTWMVIFQAFICALFGGSLGQNLYGQSLVMTSATLASATTNLIPALTFVMAVLFRLEKFELKTKAGKARVIGTLVCSGGAMILTLYKGVEIKSLSIHAGLLHNDNSEGGHLATSHLKSINQIMGPIYAIASVTSSAFGLICRTKMSARYPCHYSSTALICLMGSIQAVVFALCLETDHWYGWKLGCNIRLLAVAYSGIVSSGLMVIVIMWCVRMRGPLFVSVFSPLMLVLVGIAGFLFLEENLHLGSVVGALVIVCGLYIVLWGNAKEMERIPKPSFEKPANQQFESPKSCDMMAMGVAPNFLPALGIDASDNNGEEDDHHELEEGRSIPKGKA